MRRFAASPEGDEPGQAFAGFIWKTPPDTLFSEKSGQIAFRFPRFMIFPPVTRRVYLLDVYEKFAPVRDYVIDAGKQPTLSQGGGAWSWKRRISRDLTSLAVPAAHSVGSQESQHRREFYSGVLLGLAGGAAIAFLQEAADRISKRVRTRRAKQQA
jgi:hypothetical protein